MPTSTSDFLIRRARPEDEDSIWLLWRDLHELHRAGAPAGVFRPADDRAAFSRFLAEGRDTYVVVAVLADEVVGYVLAREVRRPPSLFSDAFHVLEIDQLSVAASARRRGVATALINELGREASARGATQLTVGLWFFNEAAYAFYRRHGFIDSQRRMGLSLVHRAD